MSKQYKRICDNCTSEIDERRGWWYVRRMKEYPFPEYSHSYITDPKIEWDFCSPECMIQKVQEWTLRQKKT